MATRAILDPSNLMNGRHPTTRRIDRAFTLVELLIVVMILGILAATVIPQFADATDDTKDSVLAEDLRRIRDAIERYMLEHNGRPPSIKENGTRDAQSDNFIARLTGKTDKLGKIDAAGAYGPYLRNWPPNPHATNVANAATVKINLATAGTGNQGWHFNQITKLFSANTAAHTSW